MPRYNGTGPRGQGPLSGRGMGYCGQTNPEHGGMGYGRRMNCGNMGRGFGRNFGYGPAVSEREMLEENMRYLEEELKAVKDALNNSKED